MYRINAGSAINSTFDEIETSSRWISTVLHADKAQHNVGHMVALRKAMASHKLTVGHDAMHVYDRDQAEEL